MRKILLGLLAPVLAMVGTASAGTISVLWWDATPTYGGQAPDAYRQEMSDYLDNFDSGTVFDATYVGSETPGTLATHLASNTYDVIIFDSTTSGTTFNASDLLAVQNFYAGGNNNLMFDGTLYIRNINYSPETDFPGPNGAMGGLLVNQIAALGQNGGGIFVGTDHNCCQAQANLIIDAIIPGAGFTGYTVPSTDGVFYGNLLLNGPQPIAAVDVFDHWSAVPSEGIAPTGAYTDFLGGSIMLNSLVDVADQPGGGTRHSYISTTLLPGGGTTDVDDDTVGGDAGDDNVVPIPVPAVLFLTGLAGFTGVRGRKKKA